ncbi:MAG: hypothetical protein ACT4P1_11360 [Sporichthyaceae bacterium]
MGGKSVRVNLAITFTGPQSNDVSRVKVRATDDGESGSFRNTSVNVTKIRLTVFAENQGTTVDRTRRTAPYSVSLSPSGNGKDVVRVSSTISFRTTAGRAGSLTCFFFDDPA